VINVSPMLPLDAVWQAARAHPAYAAASLSERMPSPGSTLWHGLPTLRKDSLRLHATAGADRWQWGTMLYFTSGTSSAPMMLPLSAPDLERIARYCADMTRLEEIQPGARVLVLLPMALWAAGTVTVNGHRLAGGHVFPVDLHGGPETWQRYADIICPTVVSSTPSVLFRWAARYRGPPVRVLETTGEPLSDEQRATIASGFGGRVHDAYGLSECVVGAECRMGNGFHFSPQAVIVDVLCPDRDEPVPAGAIGEITLTSLMQEALPILRYRTGDRGQLAVDTCPCGSRWPRVHHLGRIAQTWLMPRGVTASPAEVLEALAAAGFGGCSAAWKETENIQALEIRGPGLPSPERLAAVLACELPHLGELLNENEIFLYVRDTIR